MSQTLKVLLVGPSGVLRDKECITTEGVMPDSRFAVLEIDFIPRATY